MKTPLAGTMLPWIPSGAIEVGEATVGFNTCFMMYDNVTDIGFTSTYYMTEGLFNPSFCINIFTSESSVCLPVMTVTDNTNPQQPGGTQTMYYNIALSIYNGIFDLPNECE